MKPVLLLALLFTGCAINNTETLSTTDQSSSSFPVPRASDVEFEPNFQGMLDANSDPRRRKETK